jgi:hypothetical protein
MGEYLTIPEKIRFFFKDGKGYLEREPDIIKQAFLIIVLFPAIFVVMMFMRIRRDQV